MKKMLERVFADLSRAAQMVVAATIGTAIVIAIAIEKTPTRDHTLVVAVVIVAASFLVWRSLPRLAKWVVYTAGTVYLAHLVLVAPLWYRTTCLAVAAVVAAGLVTWIVKRLPVTKSIPAS